MNGSPLTPVLRFSGLILGATLALPLSGLCSVQVASPSDVSTVKATHKTVHHKRAAATFARRSAGSTPLIHKAFAHPGTGEHLTAASLRTPRSVATVTRSTTTSPLIRGGPWLEPTYADSTQGDRIDGEDLNVRPAAVEALGEYNGSVVVVDPSNGRVLTMVNQKE